MRRGTLNFLIDGVSLLAMIGMVSTGLLIRYALPPGSGGRLAFWSWTRHDWGDFHFWCSVSLIGLILIHVLMHWTWVCGLVGRWFRHTGEVGHPVRKGHRALIGLGTLVALSVAMGSFQWYAMNHVEATSGQGIQSEENGGASEMNVSPDRGEGRGRGWRGGRGGG